MLLIAGANYLVDGSSAIAKKLGVSTLVIGLTIVAFGTSAPELVVNILSASKGSTGLALGNVNGSNIANILLILGATAFIARIPVKSRTVLKEIPFMILAGFVLVVMSSDVLLNGDSVSQLSRIDGVLLLSFFVIFAYYMFLSTKDAASGAKVEDPKMNRHLALLYTAMGIGGLVVGGKFAVDGATGLAVAFGASETLVGLTILALGTSLPELVSSVVAAVKGETDLAVGNIVGSNIFNILLVLGVTAVVHPIEITEYAVFDSLVALGAMMFLLVALFVRGLSEKGRVHDIERTSGMIFIVFYIAYIVYILYRG